MSCCCNKKSAAERDAEEEGQMLRGRKKSVFAEHFDPEDEDSEEDARTVNPKTDVQRKRLAEAVKNVLIFRSLDHEQMNEILDAMFEMDVKANETIIQQGDDGEYFYVIESGNYDIMLKTGGANKKVGSYDNSGSFGELALLYNMPRAATVTAKTNGTVWALDRKTFRRIVVKSTYKKRKMYEDLIGQVEIFKQLSSQERMNLCDALTSLEFKTNATIIKQGDKAECMYFIESGKVRVMLAGDDNKEKQINTIGPGGYFGELALVTHKPRAASIYATEPTRCAVLDVQAFERLMGPCVNVMKRNITQYQIDIKNAFGKDAPSLLRN